MNLSTLSNNKKSIQSGDVMLTESSTSNGWKTNYITISQVNLDKSILRINGRSKHNGFSDVYYNVTGILEATTYIRVDYYHQYSPGITTIVRFTWTIEESF